jgi:uncharacterized protein YcbK (DUF882 family)
MTKRQTQIVLAVASVSIIAALMLLLYYYFVTNVKEEDLEKYKPKYFSLKEMTSSATAVSKGIDNSLPNDDVKYNLLALIMKVLDPLREAYGQPIIISSAYRCEALNHLVGGVSTSQHLKGQAADITSGTREGNKILFELIRDKGNYDQLIDESDFKWVHVSYKRVGYNRKQTLKL